jgi:ribosomal protein S14
MARKALIEKQKKLEALRQKCFAEGKKMPHATKHYNRCQITGRTKSYMRDFGIDRVTFRKYAREGKIM